MLTARPRETCVAVDFDGTLSEVVPDPDAARAVPGAADALVVLASRLGRVAVVSGRPAAFLRDALVGSGPGPGGAPASVHVVGLYGLESLAPDGSVLVAEEAERWRPVVAQAADRAEGWAPLGARVERKGLSVTLHWRESPEAEAWGGETAGKLAAALGLVAHPARKSVELRPPLAVDKGTAVEGLASGFGVVAFLGDDLGDLPAFDALDRLAASGATAVRVAVSSDEAPAELLARADVVVDGPTGALALLLRLAASAVE